MEDRFAALFLLAKYLHALSNSSSKYSLHCILRQNVPAFSQQDMAQFLFSVFLCIPGCVLAPFCTEFFADIVFPRLIPFLFRGNFRIIVVEERQTGMCR